MPRRRNITRGQGQVATYLRGLSGRKLRRPCAREGSHPRQMGGTYVQRLGSMESGQGWTQKQDCVSSQPSLPNPSLNSSRHTRKHPPGPSIPTERMTSSHAPSVKKNTLDMHEAQGVWRGRMGLPTGVTLTDGAAEKKKSVQSG